MAKPINCTKCNDTGINKPPDFVESIPMRTSESRFTWTQRMKRLGRQCWCECKKGQRLRFLWGKVDQYTEKAKAEAEQK